MDLERMARDLGKAIQESEEYKALEAAKTANDADAELQELIEKFNMIRIKLSNEMQSETQDSDKIQALDKELKDTYTTVMGNQNMMAFNIAKQEVDDMMQRISGLLMLCVNGEDPETCDPAPQGCSGSCSTCGGCH